MIRFASVAVLGLFLSCPLPEPPWLDIAQVTYLENSQSYSLTVQSYFQPLAGLDDGLWWKRDPVTWGAPVVIGPGETKLIQDYVEPSMIKIYRTDTGVLLTDTYGDYRLGKKTVGEPGSAEVLTAKRRETVPDPRYDTSALNWSLYPLSMRFGSGARDLAERQRNFSPGAALSTTLVTHF